MDNLTHSLIGAVLGQAGLKRKTGLAMPALIIAANLPDIDAPCTFYGTQSLAMRRGITHGPIALVILPLLLAGGLILYDRWQMRRGTRPDARAPVHRGWLMALCYIGTLTHPAFDWLNSYGIRLLEPLSSQWFYGDVLFIVDPWLLAILGAGIWISRRREITKTAKPLRPARLAIGAAGGYVVLNLLISVFVVPLYYDGPSKIAVSPVPVAFWRREIHTRNDGYMWKVKPPERYGRWDVSIFDLELNEVDLGPTNMADPRIAERAKNNPAAQAFLFWSRMPIAEYSGDNIILKDQRFLQGPSRGPFTVILTPE